jgi:phosphonate transport system ATP-binding protein
VFRIERLSVTFPGGVTALRPTTLAFEEGAFTVLLGHSGAGKSTLLRCLNGLVRASSGEVHVLRHGRLPPAGEGLRAVRRETGMVFQQHQLVAHHSAAANVLAGRLGHHSSWRTLLPFSRADWRIALDALDRVNLLERALARVDELSGGQQQRVGIARALAQAPRALLADEPVASLDPATAASVLHLLREVCRADGLTAVVSLHDVALARRFADRIVGLAHGDVVFDGPPSALDEGTLRRLYAGASASPTANLGRAAAPPSPPEAHVLPAA